MSPTASPLSAPAMAPGFENPVFDSQDMFRHLLEAMSYPGRIVDAGTLATAPAPLSRAAAAVFLALADYETPVWLDATAQPARDWLRFHCGCPVVADPAAARFALVPASWAKRTSRSTACPAASGTSGARTASCSPAAST